MRTFVYHYLSRIAYTQTPKADISSLQGLQRAHMKTVPFENLDISLKHPIKLDEHNLWNKIITRKRGGFCYEVNGLFASLLKEIGFEVTYLNARNYYPEDDTFGIDFAHLALLVRIPGQSTRWLVDVGRGDTFTQPLNVDDPNEQVQGLRGYWVEPFRDGYQLWQRNYDSTRERHYFFDLIPRQFPSEYLEACIYHQTSPQSIFTRKRITSRLTDDGRISLDDDGLIVTKLGKREEINVTEEERPRILKDYFGIILDE